MDGELGGCSSTILCAVPGEESKSDEGRILSKQMIASLMAGLMICRLSERQSRKSRISLPP